MNCLITKRVFASLKDAEQFLTKLGRHLSDNATRSTSCGTGEETALSGLLQDVCAILGSDSRQDAVEQRCRCSGKGGSAFAHLNGATRLDVSLLLLLAEVAVEVR